MAAKTWSIGEAYSYCAKIAQTHYENFPVGSAIIPKHLRKHFYSIYAFARGADDFADEGEMSAEQRIELLESWRAKLQQAVDGNATHPVFIALSETIRLHQLPEQLFHDLIDAFLLDVRKSRHETFDDLLDYSRRSANPVGRLILLLFGYKDERLHLQSDAICTALQLTNFWQDVLIDLEGKDRLYIPLAEMQHYGYSEAQLRQHIYCKNYIALMDSLAERTYQLFKQGRPLYSLVQGRLKWELKLVWHGGVTILELLRRNRYNIFINRPKLGFKEKLSLLTKLALAS
ncbi:MAG: squalene synthase HpnC [Acidobacteriota bacterium]|nr:squalene synthase HpnC [Blastocatellia bacterium]MDW8413294.1 squalene synthase HpnC [Acidobacteriota bacterium]